MVQRCSVKGCGRRPYRNVKLHAFPRDEELRRKWLDFCENPKANTRSGRICSRHFDASFQKKTPMNEVLGSSPGRGPGSRCLTEDAIPTLFGPSSEQVSGNSTVIAGNDTVQEASITEPFTETPSQEESAAHNSNDPVIRRIDELLKANAAALQFEKPWRKKRKIDHSHLEEHNIFEPMDVDEPDELETNELEPNEPEPNDPEPKNPSEETCTTLPDNLYVMVKGTLWKESQEILRKYLLAEEKETFLKSLLADHQKENEILLDRLRVKEELFKEEKKELEERLRTTTEQLEGKLKASEKRVNQLEAEKMKVIQETDELRRECESYEGILDKFFTPGQQRKLKANNSKRRLHWSNLDIASAISLRCASPKGYRYLRDKRKFPLPHPSTLRRWARKVSFEEGLLDGVFSLMTEKGKKMLGRDRLNIITFDKMSLNPYYCYDRNKDRLFGESKKVQVIMAQGLTGRWKQPIGYFFDTDMSEEILVSALKKLYNCGFITVGIASDLGGENRGFLRRIKISSEFNSFEHPSDSSCLIYCFADAPHLLKLVRNNFLDYGFLLDSTEITTKVIEDVLKCSAGSELRPNWKMSQTQLDVSGNARQEVDPAAKLFSGNTAESITYCIKHKLCSWRNPEVISHFFQTIYHWFDIFNTSHFKQNQLKNLYAYGADLVKQDKELEDIMRVMRDLRIIRKLKNGENTNARLPFQDGIIRSVKSLQGLYMHVRAKYGVKYILTRRLNQDTLENFFSYIRGIGATNDHPTPLEFQYRIRLYILGKDSSAIFTLHRNTKDDVDENCLLSPNKVFRAGASSNSAQKSAPSSPHKAYKKPEDADRCLTEEVLTLFEDPNQVEEDGDAPDNVSIDSDLRNEADIIPDDDGDDNDDDDVFEWNPMKCNPMEMGKRLAKKLRGIQATPQTVMAEEGLKYLAGVTAHHFRIKYPHLGKRTEELNEQDKSWICHVSKGKLTYPAPQLTRCLRIVDDCFVEHHGQRGMKTGMRAVAQVLKKATDRLKEKVDQKYLNEIPKNVIAYFVRLRTYIRIRNTNKEMKRRAFVRNQASKFNNKNYKL